MIWVCTVSLCLFGSELVFEILEHLPYSMDCIGSHCYYFFYQSVEMYGCSKEVSYQDVSFLSTHNICLVEKQENKIPFIPLFIWTFVLSKIILTLGKDIMLSIKYSSAPVTNYACVL